MSIWTVNYIKRNSFFKKKHDILKENEHGSKEVVGEYNKPHAPGSLKLYRPRFNRGVKKGYEIDLSQDELNKIVKSLGLVDKNGNVIKSANRKNISDPFFIHEETALRMEGGGTTLNDELPLDKYFLACFRKDPRFKVIGENSNPALDILVEYAVTRAGEVSYEDSQEVEEGMKAMEIFLAMDFQKRVQILNAMGVRTKEPDPEQVKNALYKKITTQKDHTSKASPKKTNIQLFLELSDTSTEELTLRDIISEARDKGVIAKNKNKRYVFGDFALGRNLQEVVDFLFDETNLDIRDDIIKACKENA